MPTFSHEVKEFLCSKTFSELGMNEKERVKVKDCCADSFFSAALLFSGKKEDGGLSFSSELPLFLEILEYIMIRDFGLEARIVGQKTKKGEHMTLLVSDSQKKTLLSRTKEIGFRCPACRGFFLRAAFLACGTVQDPAARGYHAAFLCRTAGQTAALQNLLAELALPAAVNRRKDGTLLYWKESGKIEDLLALVGAQKYAIQLMNRKIEKSIRNDVNRRQNFDDANLQRAVDRSQKVLAAISYLKEEKIFESLPESLKSTAKLLEAFPEATLQELCSRSEEPITKSGLNHRFTRLCALAEERKEQNETP